MLGRQRSKSKDAYKFQEQKKYNNNKKIIIGYSSQYLGVSTLVHFYLQDNYKHLVQEEKTTGGRGFHMIFLNLLFEDTKQLKLQLNSKLQIGCENLLCSFRPSDVYLQTGFILRQHKAHLFTIQSITTMQWAGV